MRDVNPETELEQRLRAALREEAVAAGQPVSPERLQAAGRERARRRRGWRMTAAAAVVLVAVAGAVAVSPLLAPPSIGEPSPLPSEAPSPSGGPSSVPTTAPSPPVAWPYDWPFDVPLRCGADGPIFESYVLTAPTGGEDERHPSAAALRSALGTTVDGEYVPIAGYVLVARDATMALYLTQRSTGYFAVLVRPVGEDGASTWSVEDADVCQPELALGVARGGEWELDSSAGEPTAESTRLSLLVTERACASGQAPDGRIREPFVREAEDWVGIGWAIEPLTGGQDCQGNPSVPVTVTLERPLGDRVLLDLGTFPFAERRPTGPTPTMVGPAPWPSVHPVGSGEYEILRVDGRDATPETFTTTVPDIADRYVLRIACTGAGGIAVDIDGINPAYACPGSWVEEFAIGPDLSLDLRVEPDGQIRYSLLVTVVHLPGRAAWVPPQAILKGLHVIGGDLWDVPGFRGCGWSYEPLDGEGFSESCGPSWQPIAVPLHVRAGTEVTVALAQDWQVMSLTAHIAAHDQILPSRDPRSSRFVEFDAGPAPSVTFLAPPAGDWGVRMLISGERAGDRFQVPYYFRVIVDP